MNKVILYTLIIGISVIGLIGISDVVKAKAGNEELTEFNSIVFAPDTDQAVVDEFDLLIKEEFGEGGYEYNNATLEYGDQAPVREFRIPYEGIIKSKILDGKINALLGN